MIIFRKWDYGHLSCVSLYFLNLLKWSCIVLVMTTTGVIFNFEKKRYWKKKILKHMPLGKEWGLNHWNQKPGTRCHLSLSFGKSQIFLTIPGSVLPPSPHILFFDRRKQVIHPVPLHLTLTKQRCNVHYFRTKIGPVQGEALPNDEIRSEVKRKYV